MGNMITTWMKESQQIKLPSVMSCIGGDKQNKRKSKKRLSMQKLP